jgi:hypothetical protein
MGFEKLMPLSPVGRTVVFTAAEPDELMSGAPRPPGATITEKASGNNETDLYRDREKWTTSIGFHRNSSEEKVESRKRNRGRRKITKKKR